MRLKIKKHVHTFRGNKIGIDVRLLEGGIKQLRITMKPEATMEELESLLKFTNDFMNSVYETNEG